MKKLIVLIGFIAISNFAIAQKKKDIKTADDSIPPIVLTDFQQARIKNIKAQQDALKKELQEKYQLTDVELQGIIALVVDSKGYKLDSVELVAIDEREITIRKRKK